MDWQPIETAPKKPLDKFWYGPTVLIFADDQVGIGFWDEEFGRMYAEYPEEAHSKEITHWMPLPAPPAR